MTDAVKTYRKRDSLQPVRDRQNNIVVLDDRNLSDVHVEILKALGLYTNLAPADLASLLKRNRRWIYEKLQELKSQPNEFIGQADIESLKKKIHLPDTYYLKQRGAKWLADHSYEIVYRRHDPRNLIHDARTIHALVSLEAGVQLSSDFRFLHTATVRSHPDFRQANNKESNRRVIPHPRKERIEPDTDLYGIHYLPKDSTRFFVIENDNGTRHKGETIQPSNPLTYNSTSWYEKFEAYVPFIEKGEYAKKWGLPNFWLLCTWRDETRMQKAMECLESFKSKAARRILFQLIQPDAEPGYLFTRPWSRAGYDSLFLNQP